MGVSKDHIWASQKIIFGRLKRSYTGVSKDHIRASQKIIYGRLKRSYLGGSWYQTETRRLRVSTPNITEACLFPSETVIYTRLLCWGDFKFINTYMFRKSCTIINNTCNILCSKGIKPFIHCFCSLFITFKTHK